DTSEKRVKICLKRAEQNAFRPGIQYYSNHIWLKHKARNQVILGMDACLIAVLCNMEKIIPAVLNHPVKSSHSLAWIQFAFGVLYLNSPISGIVIAHNPDLKALADHSEELEDLDFERYWLVKLNVDGNPIDRSRWLTKKQYLNKVQTFWENLYATLKSELQSNGFETAADGGSFDQNLSKAELPASKFREMIRQNLSETHKII
ncbi:MAG TPA: hypothetical protein ENN84_11295, partial [Candidatus Marinimicrobia bacterium]|nr:hypothetical protein [Candidatus Neomarinimicrobiota bacterium]